MNDQRICSVSNPYGIDPYIHKHLFIFPNEAKKNVYHTSCFIYPHRFVHYDDRFRTYFGKVIFL